MTVAAADEPIRKLKRVPNNELEDWIAERVKRCLADMGRLGRKYEGVRDGDLPPESWTESDARTYEQVRTTASVMTSLQKVLEGVFAAPPLLAGIDPDSEFIDIMRELYAGNVTDAEVVNN